MSLRISRTALVLAAAAVFVAAVYSARGAAAQKVDVYSLQGGLAHGWRDVSWNGLYDMHFRAGSTMASMFDTEGGGGEEAMYNEEEMMMEDEEMHQHDDDADATTLDDTFTQEKANDAETETTLRATRNDAMDSMEAMDGPMLAIYASPFAYGALSLHAPEPLNASSVSFYINIAPGGDPSSLLLRLDADKGGFRAQAGLPLSADAATGEWQLVVMPLSKLGAEAWDRISIQDISGNGGGFFVTDIQLDVGPVAQAFNPFQTYLPPMWPLASVFSAFAPGSGLFDTRAPATLYQNGVFGPGVATWSWGGAFDYQAISPTGAHYVTRAELRKGGGVSFSTDESFAGMNTLVFWIFQESFVALKVRFEAAEPMDLQVYETSLAEFAPDLYPGVWTMVVVPIPDLGMAWDRFSLVEHGFDDGKVIYVDSVMMYPRHPDSAWMRVFPQLENGDIPLYDDALSPGVADYSWDVNHDTQFDLPDGHRCIRATARPFGAISLKTQSPFSGMSALEFSLWLTVPTASQYVPQVQAFGYNETYPNPIDDIGEWSASIAIRFDASVPQSDMAGSGGMYEVFPLNEIANIVGGQWTRISVPLAEADPEHAWDRVSFMDTTGNGISFFLDDIVLIAP